jgi:hypothetical protein
MVAEGRAGGISNVSNDYYLPKNSVKNNSTGNTTKHVNSTFGDGFASNNSITETKEKTVNDYISDFNQRSQGVVGGKLVILIRTYVNTQIKDETLRQVVENQLLEQKATSGNDLTTTDQVTINKNFQTAMKNMFMGVRNEGSSTEPATQVNTNTVENKSGTSEQVNNNVNGTPSEFNNIALSDKEQNELKEIGEKISNGTAGAKDYLEGFYLSVKGQKDLNRDEITQYAQDTLSSITDPTVKKQTRKLITYYIEMLIHPSQEEAMRTAIEAKNNNIT